MNNRNLIKQLSKESLIYGISSVSTRMIGFIAFPFFAREFSPEDYGVINILNTLVFFAITLCSLGLDSATTRWFYDSEDRTLRQKIFSNWIISQGFLIILAILIIIICGELFFIEKFIHTEQGRLLLLIICFNMLLNLLPSILNQYFILNRLPRKVIILSISSASISMICSLLLVFKFNMGLLGFFLGQTVAFMIISLVAITGPIRIIFKIYLFDLAFLRKMIKYGISVVPAQLSNHFLLFSTGIIIYSLTSQADLGYYQVATMAATCIILITAPFGQAFQPISFSIMKKDNAPRFYSLVLDIYVSIMSFFCLSISLFYPELIKLLLTDKYSNSAFISGIITFSTFIYSINIIAVIGMAREKKIYYYGIIVTVTNIFMIALVYLLTDYFHITGTAWAFLIGQTAAVVLLFHASQKVYYIPFRIFKNGLIVILALAGFIGTTYASVYLSINLILLKFLVILSFALLLLLFNHILFIRAKNCVLQFLKNQRKINEQVA